MSKIDFIKEATHKEAMKFLDFLKRENVEVGLITEWGSIIPDKANFIIQFADEEDSKYYIATKKFLQRSKDGIFVRLKKDGKEVDMPNFNDVFEIVNLSKNYKEIRIRGREQK